MDYRGANPSFYVLALKQEEVLYSGESEFQKIEVFKSKRVWYNARIRWRIPNI